MTPRLFTTRELATWTLCFVVAAALIVVTGFTSLDADSALYAGISSKLTHETVSRWIAPQWWGFWGCHGLVSRASGRSVSSAGGDGPARDSGGASRVCPGHRCRTWRPAPDWRARRPRHARGRGAGGTRAAAAHAGRIHLPHSLEPRVSDVVLPGAHARGTRQRASVVAVDDRRCRGALGGTADQRRVRRSDPDCRRTLDAAQSNATVWFHRAAIMAIAVGLAAMVLVALTYDAWYLNATGETFWGPYWRRQLGPVTVATPLTGAATALHHLGFYLLRMTLAPGAVELRDSHHRVALSPRTARERAGAAGGERAACDCVRRAVYSRRDWTALPAQPMGGALRVFRNVTAGTLGVVIACRTWRRSARSIASGRRAAHRPHCCGWG